MSASPVETPVLLRRPPALDPPYDDERHPDAWLAGGQSPLLPSGGVPTGLTRDVITGPAQARTDTAGLGVVGASPAARHAVGQFLRVFLEVLSGRRPPTHLRSLSDPLTATAVLRAATDATRRLRQARPRGGGVRDRQVRAGAIRVCEPRDGVAEVSAVLRQGARAWALAVRLEQRRGRWSCTTARML